MSTNNKNMTIIGGSRGLGRWIAEHLRDDFNITITSRNSESGQKVADEINVNYNSDNISAIGDADIIIFSVPIENMVETIRDTAPYAPEGSLLMDVASVKREPSNALLEYAPSNVEILPCHPMFGPRVPNLKRQIIVLTPIENRSDKWFSIIKNYFEKSECEVLVTSPEEHDRYMSIVQGLTHFSFISLASAIRKLNISVKRSRSFSSPVYSLMIDMVSRVLYQNPYLYYSIQKNNMENSFARKTLIRESIYLSNLIEEGEEEDFVRNMEESAEHLDDIEEASIRSDKAISMMNQKSNILSKSLGREIGVEDAYSKEVYVGILKEIDSKNVTVDCGGEDTVLEISRLDILDSDELFQWKKENIKAESFDLKVLFYHESSEDVLIGMFKNIEPVIYAEIIEIGDKKDGFRPYTFRYSLFNVDDRDYVEEFVRGIGGIVL